ncbi:MAG TPA: hypothetical protein PKM88_15190, partial [bacterium]|nr:hypothetical protein [bacterium]
MGRGSRATALTFFLVWLFALPAAAADDALLPVVLTAGVRTPAGVVLATDDGLLLLPDFGDRTMKVQALPDSGAVRDLAVAGGILYALTERGVVRVPATGAPAWLAGPWPAGGDPEQERLSACDHLTAAAGALYVHSFNDIFRLDAGGGPPERLIHTTENISMTAVQEGTVWFGSLRGLYRWQAGMPEAEAVSPSQFGLLTPLVMTCAAVDDGKLLLGTLGAGLLARQPDGAWRVDGSEPDIYRVYPTTPGNALVLLPPDRWRRWSLTDGWGAAVTLPFGPESVVLPGDEVVVFESGGNGIQRWRDDRWETYFAGRRQLFYRGRGSLPAAVAAADSGGRRLLPLLGAAALLLVVA